MNYRTQIRIIKESGLYAKRAEVLDELIKKMEESNRSIGNLVSFFQRDGSWEAEIARRKKAANDFNNFNSYYRQGRHYLSKDLSDKIESLCDEYKKLFLSFSYEVKYEKRDNPNIKKWQELVKKYQGDLLEKEEEIIAEFRKIIGVK